MECVAFHFLNNRVGMHHDHIPNPGCQDSSGSDCERMVGRENEESLAGPSESRP